MPWATPQAQRVLTAVATNAPLSQQNHSQFANLARPIGKKIAVASPHHRSMEAKPSHNLGDLWDRSRDQEKLALVSPALDGSPRQYSYAEIDRMSARTAHALLRSGLRRGARVAIVGLNSAEYLMVHLAVMRAGLVSVPVNFKLPPKTIEFILTDCDAQCAFVDAAHHGSIPGGIKTVRLDAAGLAEFASSQPGTFASIEPEPGEAAMILYTSGSTGRPKGVVLSHDSHVWVTQRLARVVDSRHRLLVAAPMYHMNALMMCAIACAAHATCILLPKFDAASYILAIETWRCTWLTSVPTMLALVAREQALLARAQLSSVELISMGSAPLSQLLLDEVRRIFPQADIRNLYGTTEAGPVVFGPHPDGLAIPNLSTGYAAEGVDLRLVRDGQVLDRGILQIRCPALMSAYLNLPEATRSAMTEDGFYITGDVFRRDVEGFYFFVGRSDDMFTCGGENIYPAEVEQILERHPAVAQVCVVAVSDDIKGAKPVAFVVCRPGSTTSEAELQTFCLQNAAAYQHPRRVLFVDALPLAGTNKVDRKKLAEVAHRAEVHPGTLAYP